MLDGWLEQQNARIRDYYSQRLLKVDLTYLHEDSTRVRASTRSAASDDRGCQVKQVWVLLHDKEQNARLPLREALVGPLRRRGRLRAAAAGALRRRASDQGARRGAQPGGLEDGPGGAGGAAELRVAKSLRF